jgi:hypothetical protein
VITSVTHFRAAAAALLLLLLLLLAIVYVVQCKHGEDGLLSASLLPSW